MNIYSPDADVVITKDFVDLNGATIYPTSGSYRVLDIDGAVLIADTAIADMSGESTAVTIPAVHNALPEGKTRTMRLVEFTFVTSKGTYVSEERYLLESGDGLVVYENSFMGYSEALIFGMDLSNTPGWDGALPREQISALKEAYSQIVKLRFSVSDFNVDFAFNELLPEHLAVIPDYFLEDLKRAQIAEADLFLGGDPIDYKRRMGLMSETIGESSNMFRPGKPIFQTIGSRAMRYLSRYLLLRKKVTRT